VAMRSEKDNTSSFRMMNSKLCRLRARGPEIDQFVPRNEIDDRYIDSPYYIAPDGEVGQDYLASDRQSDWAARARRSLKFCEMQVQLVASHS
jgi:hypothetical protein